MKQRRVIQDHCFLVRGFSPVVPPPNTPATQHIASVNLPERAFLLHYNFALFAHRKFWISMLERSTWNSRRRHKALGWS